MVALVSACKSAPNESASAPEGETAAPAAPKPVDEPAPTGAEERAGTWLDGEVDGNALDVSSAIFMGSAGADDMQIMLSDRADLCAVMSSGALPKDAALLAITLKLTGSDNQDGPFRAGEYPLGDANPDQKTKKAAFTKLESNCMPLVQVAASEGTVTLAGDVAIGGEAKGTFSFAFGEDAVKGGFVATYCKPPELEPSGCK